MLNRNRLERDWQILCPWQCSTHRLNVLCHQSIPIGREIGPFAFEYTSRKDIPFPKLLSSANNPKTRYFYQSYKHSSIAFSFDAIEVQFDPALQMQFSLHNVPLLHFPLPLSFLFRIHSISCLIQQHSLFVVSPRSLI